MINPYRSPKPELDDSESPSLDLQRRRFPWVSTLTVLSGSIAQVGILITEGDLAYGLLGGVLAAGAFAHFIYLKVWNSRITVPFTVLLAINLFILSLIWRYRGKMRLLVDIPLSFPSQIRFDAGRDDFMLMVTCLVVTLCMMVAHSIRPNFRTALITALGFGIWYGVSLMVMKHHT